MTKFQASALSLLASIGLIACSAGSVGDSGSGVDSGGAADTNGGGDTNVTGDSSKGDSVATTDTGTGSDTTPAGDTTAGDTTPPPTDTTPPPTDTPTGTTVKTVFIILEENHSWASITGSTSANYINKTLLPMASYATQYFNPPGNHPSLPNYLWLEAGDNFGIADDNDPSVNHQSTTDHLASQLEKAGVSWMTYQEDISGTDCPLTAVGNYAPKHDPFVYFDDMTDALKTTSAHCIAHVKPYSAFGGDLASGAIGRYNFITPNQCDDMHGATGCPAGGTIKNGDSWLAAEVPKILASAAYKDNGAIFIVWDEATGGSDGPIGMIVISPLAKGAGYNNTTHYDHGSTLKTMEKIFGVPLLRGAAAAGTNDLSDLFKAGAIP